MPLYEYECLDCGERMEILQSHGERAKRKCPDCGGRLKKAVSAPAFQFKGSGWYVTDYADKKSGKDTTAKSQDGGSGGSESKETSKSSDSKSKTSKKSKKKSS